MAGVEGLRALAAGAVLLHHAPMLMREPGTPPVDLQGPLEGVFADLRWGLTLFFVLSGFLLYRPFAAAVLRGRSRPSIRRYARNRVLRILPAYWVILAATFLVLGTATRWPASPPDGWLFVLDALLVQNYQAETVLTGIGPAWTLAVEAVFYVLLPLIAMGAMALAGRRWSRVAAALSGAVVLIVIGLAGKVMWTYGHAPDIAGINTYFPVHCDLFGVGMAAAVVHVLVEDGRLTLPQHWRTAAIALVLGFGVAAAASGPVLGWETAGELADSLVGVGCALLLLAVCVPGGTSRAARVLEARVVVWVGLVSYSVYLWHAPLFLWLADRGVHVTGSTGSLLAAIAAGAAATLALSALTYYCVERPAQRRRAPRTMPQGDSGHTAASYAR